PYHVSFDVLAPTTLLSVDGFPTASINSSASIVIQDNANNTLITVPYVTTVTGGSTPQTIPINLALAPGSGYKIGQGTNISLYRNTSGASYPYTSPVINVTGNNFSTSYYYYFYNFQYSSTCTGPRVAVDAVVNPEPIVNLGNDTSFCTVGTPTLVLDAGNAGATYLWDDASTNQTRT